MALLPKRVAAPMACLLICLACALGFPLYWHKLAFGPSIQWIGWKLHLEDSPRAVLPAEKRELILATLQQICVASARIPRKSLQTLVGRLVWYCAAAAWLRPWLQFWFHALNKPRLHFLSLDILQLEKVFCPRRCLGAGLAVRRRLCFGWNTGGATLPGAEPAQAPGPVCLGRQNSWLACPPLSLYGPQPWHMQGVMGPLQLWGCIRLSHPSVLGCTTPFGCNVCLLQSLVATFWFGSVDSSHWRPCLALGLVCFARPPSPLKGKGGEVKWGMTFNTYWSIPQVGWNTGGARLPGAEPAQAPGPACLGRQNSWLACPPLSLYGPQPWHMQGVMRVISWNIHLEMDDLGYPVFRKPP